MKSLVVELPDSFNLSAAEAQQLILASLTAKQAAPGTADAQELAVLLGRPVSPEEVADIRHLIGLYYAERATQLVGEQWNEQGWTAETMHDWLREHLRTAHN
ncbi:hypothetical protein Q5H93_19635 [Hymenobacter sp. ASUV-10]|uniref:Uncharacterized protein n=1 Tax=Hymenobacter aranciens TaxID=3063996 RepID=A0ABT9BH25_9BACT|nr:hypothetical protein [Hymenobacter sp. ASUV-10]MDO7876968.1 hypothetical protein [Hymenobacter sp. ASUV-10]